MLFKGTDLGVIVVLGLIFEESPEGIRTAIEIAYQGLHSRI